MGRQPLPQRVLVDQYPQPFRHRAVPAQRELGPVERLDGGQPLLLQRRGRRGNEGADRTGQRTPAPQPQAGPQQAGRLVQVSGGGRGVRLGHGNIKPV